MPIGAKQSLSLKMDFGGQIWGILECSVDIFRGLFSLENSLFFNSKDFVVKF